jgi:hypothetical protein
MSGKPIVSFGTFAEAFAACSGENSCFPRVPMDMVVDVLMLEFVEGYTREKSVALRRLDIPDRLDQTTELLFSSTRM